MSADDTVLVQVAVPSRQSVPAYRRSRLEVLGLVDEVNRNHGRTRGRAVQLITQGLPCRGVVAHYLAAGILQALTLPAEDRRRRSRLATEVVVDHDVHAWAAGFLERLEAPGPATTLSGPDRGSLDDPGTANSGGTGRR